MLEIYVSEVGDGLCSLFLTKFRYNIQLDCGGNNQNIASEGFERIISSIGKPHRFILSHFHLDHYVGLFSPNLFKRFYIQKAYFPKLPEFPKNDEFLHKLVVLELMTYGATSGSIEYDFLESICRLNHSRSIDYLPLYEGVEENINGTKIEVLSPPHSITDIFFTDKIKELISRFNQLLDEDDRLRARYDDVYGSELVWKYMNQKEDTYERRTKYGDPNSDYKEAYFENDKGISDEIKILNKEFREAANRISLAFKINNEFLFLGDLEKNELRRVMNKLDGYYNYIILLNPHHGTHWQKNMNRLRVDYSISSVGHGLISKFEQNYKSISNKTLSTYCNGDIFISNLPRAHSCAL